MVGREARAGRPLVLWLVLATAFPGPARAQTPPSTLTRELRVCADPNNLPFSNRREEGFENRIAEILAREMGATLRYHWIPQRRGWVRRATREAILCDLAIGVPAGDEMLLTTRAYYRSTYVFVQRADRPWHIRSFDNPALRGLRVGVHLIGDDYQNTPPAHALARRGLITNVVGYSLFGDYAEDSPPARLIEAVAGGKVDVAIAWGPMAAYFARGQGVELEVTAVSPQVDLPVLPFVYDISIGVRRTEGVSRYEDARARALRDELDVILQSRSAEVRRVLDAYGVPVLD